jgi:hypothetical protein
VASVGCREVWTWVLILPMGFPSLHLTLSGLKMIFAFFMPCPSDMDIDSATLWQIHVVAIHFVASQVVASLIVYYGNFQMKHDIFIKIRD